jgi:hemerythrin
VARMLNHIIVQWQSSYSVGIKVIDEQHMKLIKLTNKLFSSCLSGQERSKADSIFMEVLQEVIDYAGYHFSTEEKIMERINYPEYKIHKREHVNFVKEVLHKVEDFNSSNVHTPLSFVYYLRDWVLEHIAVNDKKLGQYLLDLKRAGTLEQIVIKVKKDAETNKLEVM